MLITSHLFPNVFKLFDTFSNFFQTSIYFTWLCKANGLCISHEIIWLLRKISPHRNNCVQTVVAGESREKIRYFLYHKILPWSFLLSAMASLWYCLHTFCHCKHIRETVNLHSIQCEADGKRFYCSWQINHISIEKDNINTSCSTDVTLFVWVPKTINIFKIMLYSSSLQVNK